MKAKIKSGHHLVFLEGTHLNNIETNLVVNLYNRWDLKRWYQWKNHLIIETWHGTIDFVFTGEIPKVEFDYEEKDQLAFKIIKK